MSQHWLYIPDKCHVVIKLFDNFEVKLSKRYHVVMNSLHYTFFVKLMQRWCNFVLLTLRRCCEFGVTVIAFYWRCYYNIIDTLWGEFTIQRWGNIRTTLWIWRLSIEVVKALWILRRDFQGFQCSMYSAPWVKVIIQCWGRYKVEILPQRFVFAEGTSVSKELGFNPLKIYMATFFVLSKHNLILLWIMMKYGQTLFRNLAV